MEGASWGQALEATAERLKEGAWDIKMEYPGEFHPEVGRSNTDPSRGLEGMLRADRFWPGDRSSAADHAGDRYSARSVLPACPSAEHLVEAVEAHQDFIRVDER